MASTNAVANSRVRPERIAVCNIRKSSNWQTKGRAETVMENAESIRERSGIVFVILCELRDSVKKTGVRRLLPGKSAVIILRAARNEAEASGWASALRVFFRGPRRAHSLPLAIVNSHRVKIKSLKQWNSRRL